jgi:hypothetical protein
MEGSNKSTFVSGKVFHLLQVGRNAEKDPAFQQIAKTPSLKAARTINAFRPRFLEEVPPGR